MKLDDIIAKDLKDCFDNHLVSNGPSLIDNLIASPNSDYVFIHLCCMVPSSLGDKVRTAVQVAASDIIDNTFGDPISDVVETPNGVVDRKKQNREYDS